MTRLAALLAPVALAGALTACANDPYNPLALGPSQAPVYAAPYAAPVPAAVGSPYAPGYAAARPADPTGYCTQSYVEAVDAGNRAAYTGTPIDVSRAQNTAGFYRRDC